MTRRADAFSTVLFGVCAVLACAAGTIAALLVCGCALRWDRSASSGDVVEFRAPAPCAPTLTQGGSAGTPPQSQEGGARGGTASP